MHRLLALLALLLLFAGSLQARCLESPSGAAEEGTGGSGTSTRRLLASPDAEAAAAEAGAAASSPAAPDAASVAALAKLISLLRQLSGGSTGPATGASTPPAADSNRAQPAPSAASPPAPAPAQLGSPGSSLPSARMLEDILQGPEPDWVTPLPEWEECGGQRRQQAAAAAAVQQANGEGRRLDVVLWGDSLTAELARKPAAAWGAAFEGLDALPLGSCGSTVQNLAWRMVHGGERPALAPRVALFLVGVNNAYKEPELGPLSVQLDWLLDWTQATWPETQVALVALLPAVPRWAVVGPTNEAWAALAARKRLPLIRCGQELDPTDTSLFTDGLHQTDAGRELLARCLRAAVEPLLQQQQQRQPGAS